MKRTIQIIGAALTALLLMFAMSGCSGSTSNVVSAQQKDQQISTDVLHKMQQAQPAPEFDYSQIRQTLIDAQTAQAQSTQTTTFFMNMGVADPVFFCPSIGFPVAGTAQITNPDQVIQDHSQYGGGNAVVSQIDPNGIYSGSNTATFVICVNAAGKPYLHHAEEFAHSVAGPAVWDYTHHRIEITGAPTFAPKVGK